MVSLLIETVHKKYEKLIFPNVDSKATADGSAVRVNKYLSEISLKFRTLEAPGACIEPKYSSNRPFRGLGKSIFPNVTIQKPSQILDKHKVFEISHQTHNEFLPRFRTLLELNRIKKLTLVFNRSPQTCSRLSSKPLCLNQSTNQLSYPNKRPQTCSRLSSKPLCLNQSTNQLSYPHKRPQTCSRLSVTLCLNLLTKPMTDVPESKPKSKPQLKKKPTHTVKANPLSKEKLIIPCRLCDDEGRPQDLHGGGEANDDLLSRCGDVHPNPGPGDSRTVQGSIQVTTYNVRGLSEENKLRHLSNHFSKKLSPLIDSIICLQETYIERTGKLPYIWRGNIIFTPGTGHGCGVITLLSPHINVLTQENLDNRAHIAVCQKVTENKPCFIIANLYAPNANNHAKIEFFESVLNKISELEESYECRNILVAGDLNLIFQEGETKNRRLSSQEIRTSKIVGQYLSELGLEDSWKGKKSDIFTWKRANSDTFSCLDRIFFRNSEVKLKSINANWALSQSDHAAVECCYDLAEAPVQERNRIYRINPHLLNDPNDKNIFCKELESRISEIPSNWDPHMKLEYIKMCIRTISEKLQAEKKRFEKSEEEQLNEELQISIRALESPLTPDRDKAELIRHVEELRNRKEILIEEKGKRLAQKLGTKWYNEGEKSTKYFFRLLNRAVPDDFKEIETNTGSKTSEPKEIEEEIVNFYRNLYETFEDNTDLIINNDPDFFNHINPISDDSRTKVVAPIEAEELRNVLATCSDSAPGPDGIPYSILRILWPHIGKFLTESWNHSLMTGNLAPSHKVSYLKLIPKVGKEKSKLTNWRPITLSNCDHKIITKLYANRMSKEVSSVLSERQTAYIKGRLINDNIRALLMVAKISNLEEEMDNLIVSLDAKKAFDSVSHNYIELCLKKFGLENFVPIFRVLYSDLRSDILINGKIVKGFKIKRGVKQGDALSCILFIMCVEPLLSNIDNNAEIEPINSRELGSELPKAYAYADDVSCAIKRTNRGVQEIFNEYQRLTRISGLELNADKTEILKLSANRADPEEVININYMGSNFGIMCKKEIKINGILLQQDFTRLKDRNVEAVIQKIDVQFSKWTRRSLSTLGKILIAKTFGISQIIFLLQSMVLEPRHFKKLNSYLYKFVWNRHYRAAKAPERIKRAITNTSINEGGLGMLDIGCLDESLKLRALGRVLNTIHPLLSMIKDKLDLSDYFHPIGGTPSEEVSKRGIELLAIDRKKLWLQEERVNKMGYNKLIGSVKLKNILTPNGRNSIPYFMLTVNGKKRLSQLSRREWHSIRGYSKQTALNSQVEELFNRNLINTQIELTQEESTLYPTKKAFANLACLTSKSLRENRHEPDQICIFKAGLILTPGESLNYFNKVRRLTCTRQKNTLLRSVHGDIYTREKLFRFGLIESPICEFCDQVETLEHKLIVCERANRIWTIVLEATDKLRLTLTQAANEDFLQRIFGACLDTNLAIITIHAEIIQRLLLSSQPLPPPNILLQSVLLLILAREKKEEVTDKIRTLLSGYYSFQN